jgi:thiol-disulfide isomerase/thioredoxin
MINCSIKQIIIGSIIVMFWQYSYGQEFTLKGKIAGYDGCYVTLVYFRDGFNKRQTDTAIISKGEFRFYGRVTGADFAQLVVHGSKDTKLSKYNTQVFLEPGLISIWFAKPDMSIISIVGSEVQREYDAFKKKIIGESKILIELSKHYNAVDSMLKEGVITVSKAEEQRKEIDKKYNPIIQKKTDKEILYIKRNPNSYVSLLLLYTFVGRLSSDSIDMIYKTISEKVKGSTIDYSFLAYNARVRKAISKEYSFDLIKLNESAPFFTIYKPSGKDSMSGHNFFGKVVILEFWGLYCHPCLKVNPLLEQIRKKYGDNKLVIIAVNDNRINDLSQMTTYINRNKLSEWVHVFINSEIGQSQYPVFKGNFDYYSGLGVPRTIVIDKIGKVAYKNYGYSAEEFQNFTKMIERLIDG